MFYKYKPGVYSMTKTSEQWFDLLYKDTLTILDPDGWDRSPDGWEYSWNEELITRTEFEKRLCQSTCVWKISKL